MPKRIVLKESPEEQEATNPFKPIELPDDISPREFLVGRHLVVLPCIVATHFRGRELGDLGRRVDAGPRIQQQRPRPPRPDILDGRPGPCPRTRPGALTLYPRLT
jgi:hypothetical protein